MADEARSRLVWDAIDGHTTASFQITPEDFYTINGGDAVLSCNEVVPVIKTMGLYVTRPGGDLSNQVLNGLGRWFSGLAGQTQSFVGLDGPRIYQLANAVWQHYEVPVRYGESEAALTTFLAASRQTRPVGLSPTGQFDLDFSILDTLSPSGLAPDDPTPATAVSLVLEIDSRAVASRPTWVNRCQ